MQIKFLKIKKKFKKGGIGANPDFLWDVLLLITFLSIIIFFIFGFLFLKQINQESILPTNNINEKSQTIDKERIKKVLEYFSNREKKSVDILNSPTPITDPSL